MLPLMTGPQRETFEKLPLTQSNRGTIYHRNAWNLNLATPINQSINQSIIWQGVKLTFFSDSHLAPKFQKPI